jgi:hypothetical protein
LCVVCCYVTASSFCKVWVVAATVAVAVAATVAVAVAAAVAVAVAAAVAVAVAATVAVAVAAAVAVAVAAAVAVAVAAAVAVVVEERKVRCQRSESLQYKYGYYRNCYSTVDSRRITSIDA